MGREVGGVSSTIVNVLMEAEKLETSYIAIGNAEWCIYVGKWLNSFLFLVKHIHST